MKDNHLCIHGHFYQPPRENPWMGVIEYQPSASPYHDWNERVTRECYGPNTRARIEEDGGRILRLLNNYEYMNFDFGPTLLSWLEKLHPWIYQEILAADRASCRRYHGHGNAMAQVYNHIIMPLANTRDKRTQIRWGLADFSRRFGRPAEGMWLAETAVDMESLALLAEEGVRFTVLAPSQAEAVRPIGGTGGRWKKVGDGNIDTTKAYRVFPRGGSSPFIDLFFFDQEISRAVAYEKILSSGSDFLARLESGVGDGNQETRLVNIATDGESYGHHFKFGDMALAWVFDCLERQGKLKLTNYGWFLEQFPPSEEVRILENTSWSCVHGVERWRSDCGCNVGHREGWNQAWRAPLREAMDWLSAELAVLFEEQGGNLFKDPWAARDDYGTVLCDPSPENRDRFLERHCRSGKLGEEQKVKALELMECQRMALYMYTSCGWFFDDIGGLEATQVLMYADRAMNLAKRWSRSPLEKTFVSIISRARSNDPDLGDGANVFERLVRKRRMSPGRIASNVAFAGLFRQRAAVAGFFNGSVSPGKGADDWSPGMGEAKEEVLIRDPMTGRNEKIIFSIAGNGPEDFVCRVRSNEEQDGAYSFLDIIPDTRRIIMKAAGRGLMKQGWKNIGKRDLLDLLSLVPPPEEPEEDLGADLKDILRIFLRGRFLGLADAPETTERETASLKAFMGKLQTWNYTPKLDDPETKITGQEVVNLFMHQIGRRAGVTIITTLMDFLDLADAIGVKIDLWECQNRYWDLSRDEGFFGGLSARQAEVFRTLGRRLGFRA